MRRTAVRSATRSAMLVIAALAMSMSLAACGDKPSDAALATIPGFTPTESDQPTDPPTPTPTLGGTGRPTAATAPTPTPSTSSRTSSTTSTTRHTTSTTTGTGWPTGTPSLTPTPTPTPSVTVVLPSVDQVLADEATAAGSATSVHVVGSVVTQAGSFGVDLRIGGNASGTLSYSQGVISVRRVGGELFISGNDAFFSGHGHPELVATHGGQWIQITSADPAYTTIVPLTYLTNWTDIVHAAPATAVKAATVGGVAMLQLTGGSGGKANSVFVPASGATRPASVTSADGADRLTFTQWNSAATSVSVPSPLVAEPNDAVLDVPTYPEATASAFSSIWQS